MHRGCSRSLLPAHPITSCRALPRPRAPQPQLPPAVPLSLSLSPSPRGSGLRGRGSRAPGTGRRAAPRRPRLPKHRSASPSSLQAGLESFLHFVGFRGIQKENSFNQSMRNPSLPCGLHTAKKARHKMRLGDFTETLRSQRYRLGPLLLLSNEAASLQLELPPVDSERRLPAFWCQKVLFHTQCHWQHFSCLPAPHPQRAVPGGGHGRRQAERDAVTSAEGSGPGPHAPMGSPFQTLGTRPDTQRLVSCSPRGTPGPAPWVVEGVRCSRPAPRALNWVQCWDPSTKGPGQAGGSPAQSPQGGPMEPLALGHPAGPCHQEWQLHRVRFLRVG